MKEEYSHQRRRDIEPVEAVWSYETFKQRMLDVSRDRKRGLVSYERLPRELLVGKLGDKAVQCGRETARDGKERGSVARFYRERQKIELKSELFVGTEKKVSVYFRDTPEHATRTVGLIHSHPTPQSFSTGDLLSVLQYPETLFSLLSTSDHKIHALVTTHDTEWLSAKAGREKGELWDKQLEERFHAVRQDSLQSLRQPLDVQAQIELALVRTVAKKYKFGYYVGDELGLLDRVV